MKTKIHFDFLRPSNLVRDAEDGFVYAAQLLRAIARGIRQEYDARQLADASRKLHTLAMRADHHDFKSVIERTDTLLKRKGKQAPRIKITVPAPRPAPQQGDESIHARSA